MHQRPADIVKTARARLHAFFSPFFSWFAIVLFCVGSLSPQLVIAQAGDVAPVANPVSAAVAYGSGANPITLYITDGVPTSVAIGSAPAHGTAIASGLTVTYQPNPGYAGSDSFTYTATNDGGTSTPATVTITVGNPVTAVTASGPFAAQIGVAYTQTFSWNGGAQPFTDIQVTGLPAGLSITATTVNSATVSGTPSAAGSFGLTATATDSSTGNGPFTVSQGFTLSVSAPTLTLTPAAGTLSATYGTAFSQTYVAGGGTAPYNYAISAGALPAGLGLDPVTGVLSGTPTATGLYTFSVRARDSSTGTGAPFARTQNYVMQVAAPTIVVSPTSFAAGQVGAAYSATATATGGIAPYTFAIPPGSVPPGLTLSSSGTLSGTPTAGGSFNFTVIATDAHGQTGTRAHAFTVSTPTISLVPATLVSGSVANVYSQTITASGGTGGYSFAVTAGSLPAGLSLSNGGVISGTPTAGGYFNFTVTATDSSTGSGPYTGSRAYTLSIGASTINLPATSLANAAVASAYNATLNPATGGTAPYTYAVTGGNLPASLVLSASGTLSGTPTAPGTFNFSVVATDSSGGDGPYSSAPQNYRLDINDAPVAHPVSVNVGYGANATPVTLNITGGTPASVAVTGAPQHGTAIASGTSITYQPAAGFSGPDSFTYTATNSGGTSAAATVTANVADPVITISTSGPMTANVGTPYSQVFTWSGGAAPYTNFNASGLPAGLSVTATGTNSLTVSGTPTAAGTFNSTVSARDSGTGTGPFTVGQVFAFMIGSPTLSMTPAPGNLPMNYGVASSINFAASGGTAPYSFSLSAGSLPIGVSLTSTGVLSGMPTVPGNYNVTVRATDSSTGTGAPFRIDQSYTIVVALPGITISPPSLPNGTVATAYNQSFTATGGVAPYTFSLTAGAMPVGMSLSSAGVLSGTPRSDGNFSLTLRATDANGQSASKVYTFTIAPATLTISPATLPSGVVGTAYSQSLSSSGGIAPYTYTLASGSLPIGIALGSAGVLSGTPTSAGSYGFSVRSTDDAGYNTTVSYTVEVATSIVIDPSSIPDGTAGVAYGQTFSATGGVAPYTFSLSAGALPIGISLSSTGALSGVPRSDGNFSLTLQATDNNGRTASKIYSFNIAPAVLTVSPATLPAGVVGNAYSQSLSSSGGIAPYAYSLASGTLPPGIALSSAGVLSGTPTSAGSYGFTVRSTDDAGYNTAVNYTVVVADAMPVAVDDSASTLANQAVTIDVITNDAGIITSVVVASAPAHGTATSNGTSVVYAPASNYFGSDSFTYAAVGPGGTSVPATVKVAVNALPVPMGQPQNATTLSTQAITIDAAAGATGAPFTGVTLLAPPSSGTATLQGTRILYTPAADTAGAIALNYTLNNPFGASAPITSTITVNPVPVAMPKRVRTVAGATATIDLTQGARGGPFTGATLVSLSPASSGTAAVVASNGGYTLSYTPVIGYSGVAVATFTLSNAYASSAPATVEIEVAPRSDPSRDAEVLGILNAQAEATRRFANAQIGNFQRRMEGLHGGGTNGSRFDNGLSFSIDTRCRDGASRNPGSDCRNPDLGDERAAVEARPGMDRPGAQYGFWTGGTLQSGNRDSRSGGSGGLDFETSGISLGADYRVRRDFAFGGGIGYGRDDTDVGTHRSRSKGESYSAALYASYHPGERFYLDGLLGYQWLSFDSRRYVTDTGGMVNGSRDGSQWFASVSTGLEYQHEQVRITPYARLDAARATLDGYTESGDAQYVLDYRGQHVDTTTTSLGLRLDWRYSVRWGMLSPQLRLEYQHDFQDASDTMMSYADMAGGPLYHARLRDLDRNRFVFGLGAMLQTERDWALRLEYRGLFGSDNDSDRGVLLNLEKKY